MSPQKEIYGIFIRWPWLWSMTSNPLFNKPVVQKGLDISREKQRSSIVKKPYLLAYSQVQQQRLFIMQKVQTECTCKPALYSGYP
jgi:hypothetical protein